MGLLFHPHAAASRATTERLPSDVFGLGQVSLFGRICDGLDEERGASVQVCLFTQHRARRVAFVVDPSEIARVVVGHFTLQRFRGAEQALLNKLCKELGVVNHLIVAIELMVFVLKGVHAVRAGGEHSLEVVLGERRHVPHGFLLEEELISEAPRGVPRAGLFLAETGKVDSGFLKQLGDGLCGADAAGVSGPGATHPEQDVELLLLSRERNLHVFHPFLALVCARSPGVAGASGLAKDGRGGSAQSSFCHQVSASIYDEVDVADEHGASFHTCVARRASPQRLFGDPGGDARFVDAGTVDALHHFFGIQSLAHPVRGANICASAALHAGIDTQDVPSGEIGGFINSDFSSLLDLFHAESFEFADGPFRGSGGTGHRENDVFQPHVGKAHDESHHENGVNPPKGDVSTRLDGRHDFGNGISNPADPIPRLRVRLDPRGLYHITRDAKQEEETNRPILFPAMTGGSRAELDSADNCPHDADDEEKTERIEKAFVD